MMGKTFVICEVVKVPFGEGYRPVVRPEGDPTWIDRRHVIDEPGLHQRIWAVCDYEKGDIDVAVQILLDSPKPEVDKWEELAKEYHEQVDRILTNLKAELDRIVNDFRRKS